MYARLKHFMCTEGKSWLFILPWFLIFMIFTVVPFASSVVLSFTNFNMIEKPEFIGGLNYIRLMWEDDVFGIAIKNTLLLAIVTGPAGFLLSFVFDVSHLFTSPYAWSALCLACALVCVGAGFWFGEVALRRFGLVVALTCVAKIVLFDISGDVFVHAIALIAGGLACLGISALYALASKRFAA